MVNLLRNRLLHVACGALGALVTIACSAAPPPPPIVEVAAPPAPPPEPAAHWIRTGGATSPGVPWGDDRVVLVGGRRAILARDGTLRPEVAPMPEPLLEIFLVPAAGGPKLVARSEHAVYRLDDPLGPAVTLARTARVPLRAGAGPGVVGVWARGIAARFLDVITGEPRALAGIAQPAFVDGVAFRNAREGVILLGTAGLFVTVDGGASLRPVGARFDAVEVRGSALVARRGNEDVEIDPAGARVGGAPPPVAEGALFEGWAAAHGGDPLVAAARGGVRLAGGDLLVADAWGGVARVDPATGAVRARIPLPAFDRAWGRGGCGIGGAPQALWLTCDIGERGMIWPLATAPLPTALGAPALELHRAHGSTSPSGGVRLGDRVRQPDGAWVAVARAEGALADGRAVSLLIPPAKGEPGAPTGDAPQIQITGPGDHVEALAPLGFYPRERFTEDEAESNQLALVGAVEEGASHVLSFVMADRREAFAVTQAPGHEAVSRTFSWARIHAGHGIAADDQGLFASTDGGVTWAQVPAPEGFVATTVREARIAGAYSGYRSRGYVDVSEGGARIGDGWIRLGWGETAPIAPAPALGGPSLDGDARARRLVCTSAPGAAGAPAGNAPRAKPPAGVDLRQAPAAKGGRHVHRFVSLDAGQASITLDATDAKATSPATLTLRWTGDDHAAQAISVTGPAPAGLGWEPRGIAARVAGTEVTATIRSGAQVYVLHGKRGGRLAYADIPSYEDWSTIRFGATPEDPLSWVERSPAGVRVMLWSPGHPPRALSTLPVTATLPASRGGLPVLLDTASSTLLRVLPFPVRGEAPAPSAAETVPLDGWTDLGAREGFFLRLPVCGAKAQGAATTVYEPVTVRVDGVDERTSGAVVEVRAGTAGACIAGLRWAAGRDPGSSSLWHYRRVDADVVTQRAVAVPFHGEGRAVTCKLGEAG